MNTMAGCYDVFEETRCIGGRIWKANDEIGTINVRDF
jgi:hypothetical protein